MFPCFSIVLGVADKAQTRLQLEVTGSLWAQELEDLDVKLIRREKKLGLGSYMSVLRGVTEEGREETGEGGG